MDGKQAQGNQTKILIDGKKSINKELMVLKWNMLKAIAVTNKMIG